LQPILSTEICKKLCLDDPACGAYAYVINAKTCYIKNFIPQKTAMIDHPPNNAGIVKRASIYNL